MSVWVVVGGQYGSEGKGKVSAYITLKEEIDICVRCGGPNSGHSFVHEDGTTKVLRQLPTGYINPRTRLLIPAGALIDPSILKYEIEAFGIDPSRVGVDKHCFVITESDRETERKLGLRERLSSTLCGVGAAVARRALRGEDAKQAREIVEEQPWLRPMLTDVSKEVNSAVDHDRKVLIEGTQGFGLSLYHSDHYPKATSRDTSAAGFISEVGVSPRLVTEIVVVFRTFPIRVAGEQAGPLNDEITWEQIKRESGYPYDPTEMTSVTHKIRRVGRFDWDLAERAVITNRPTLLAINGLDYLDYRNFGVAGSAHLTDGGAYFVRSIARRLGVKVDFGGVGPGLSQIISLAEQVETVAH
ncbi:MAG TPA: adenylosuccinate synthetase [Terriglobia bacterium]|nr:adenylosuccinate synthetase [Terriglobia bacterium]